MYFPSNHSGILLRNLIALFIHFLKRKQKINHIKLHERPRLRALKLKIFHVRESSSESMDFFFYFDIEIEFAITFTRSRGRPRHTCFAKCSLNELRPENWVTKTNWGHLLLIFPFVVVMRFEKTCHLASILGKYSCSVMVIRTEKDLYENINFARKILNQI